MFANMHSISSYFPSGRVLNDIRSMKFLSGYYLKTLFPVETSKQLYCSISRIICTDTKLKALSRVQIGQEIVPYPTPFLKENFNIVENRYFKLVCLSNDSHLEELLRNKEFKDMSSRMSLSVDLNVMSSSVSGVNFYSFEDICKSSCEYMEKLPSVIHQESALYSSSDTKENDTGKPTEKQLLHVIDRLTYSLHNFFEKPHDYSVYHKNVIFQNFIRGVTTRGLPAYIQAMYLLRLYGLFHYAKVKVEILKITHHIEDGTVRVRWRVNGVSRRKLLMSLWKLKNRTWHQYIQDESEWLDGFSVFSVGPDGLIYKHICDKLTPDDDALKLKKSDLKSKLLGLFDLSPRGPATGSLHALLSSCRSQVFPSCKRIT